VIDMKKTKRKKRSALEKRVIKLENHIEGAQGTIIGLLLLPFIAGICAIIREILSTTSCSEQSGVICTVGSGVLLLLFVVAGVAGIGIAAFTIHAIIQAFHGE